MPNAQPNVGPEALAGAWTLDRTVLDRRTNAAGTAVGTLDIDPASGRWIERAQLTWAGRTVPVARNLGFTRADGEWWMTFSDGRRFHPFRWDVPVEHLCGTDRYRGRLSIDAQQRVLRIAWEVDGPAKDQRIVTRYARR